MSPCGLSIVGDTKLKVNDGLIFPLGGYITDSTGQSSSSSSLFIFNNPYFYFSQAEKDIPSFTGLLEYNII